MIKALAVLSTVFLSGCALKDMDVWRGEVGPCPNEYATNSSPKAINTNFGCTEQSNMNAMLADPSDMLPDKFNNQFDGEALSQGVKKYHQGEQSELIESDVKSQ